MFILSDWIKTGLLNGFFSGEFSQPFVQLKCVDYLSNGIFTEAHVAEIAQAMQAFTVSIEESAE